MYVSLFSLGSYVFQYLFLCSLAEAVVDYDYERERDDELSISEGDVITNVVASKVSCQGVPRV